MLVPVIFYPTLAACTNSVTLPGFANVNQIGRSILTQPHAGIWNRMRQMHRGDSPLFIWRIRFQIYPCACADIHLLR
jgi:hypothetical protein